jgi:hypothetical protein
MGVLRDRAPLARSISVAVVSRKGLRRARKSLLAGVLACLAVQAVCAAPAANESLVRDLGGSGDGIQGNIAPGGPERFATVPCLYGCGTVFAIDPKTGKEKVLHSF